MPKSKGPKYNSIEERDRARISELKETISQLIGKIDVEEHMFGYYKNIQDEKKRNENSHPLYTLAELSEEMFKCRQRVNGFKEGITRAEEEIATIEYRIAREYASDDEEELVPKMRWPVSEADRLAAMGAYSTALAQKEAGKAKAEDEALAREIMRRGFERDERLLAGYPPYHPAWKAHRAAKAQFEGKEKFASNSKTVKNANLEGKRTAYYEAATGYKISDPRINSIYPGLRNYSRSDERRRNRSRSRERRYGGGSRSKKTRKRRA